MTFLDPPVPIPALLFAALSALSAIIISLHNVFGHVSYYTQPRLQIYIVRIILIVPIYALASFFSLLFQSQALYFDVVRDIYESFVIYCFLTLMLEYAGGESNIVHCCENKLIPHPVPCCCLPRMEVNLKFLKLCKRGTLQFIILKPVMAIISIIMLSQNEYESHWYQITLQIIYNIAYGIALYVLLLFYMATKGMLAGFNPVFKFMAVKFVVFMTFWQFFILSLLPQFTHREVTILNDFIMCFEMSLFAILHRYAFSYREYQTPALHKLNILENVSSVLSLRDVAADTVHSFTPANAEYVLTNNHSTRNAVVPVKGGQNGRGGMLLSDDNDEMELSHVHVDQVLVKMPASDDADDHSFHMMKEGSRGEYPEEDGI